MCMRHKSPVTSSFHFSIWDIVNTLYFKPKIHYTLRKCILLRARAYYVQPCVSVCMCCETAVSANCGGKRPQTAHTETHRLQSTIHLNLPIYVFSPPTKHLEGPQTPLPSSIYKKPLSSTSIPSSIHLPPFSWPPLYVLSISLCQALSNST